jgi:hypothetical protein
MLSRCAWLYTCPQTHRITFEVRTVSVKSDNVKTVRLTPEELSVGGLPPLGSSFRRYGSQLSEYVVQDLQYITNGSASMTFDLILGPVRLAVRGVRISGSLCCRAWH